MTRVGKRAYLDQPLRVFALSLGLTGALLQPDREGLAVDRLQVGTTGDWVVDKWSELRTVLYVAKHGTVSAAAGALGLHRATVNRHIDALETEIGARIFLRHANGYTLTETGEDVLRVAQATRDLTDELVGRVRGKSDQIEGEIKLTLLAPFAGLVIDAIDAFRAENPKCRVVVDASEDLARLEYGEAHVAIRSGRKPDHPDYVVQNLGRVRLNLFAHESYLARYGHPNDVDDFKGHRFVVPGEADQRLPFLPWIEKNVPREAVVMSSDDIWVTIEAISWGLGLGFLAEHEAQVRSGLVQLLPVNRAWSARLWLTTHVDVHRTDKVQAMLKCIRASFNT